MTKSFLSLPGALLCTLTIAGCASYHDLPLPQQARLFNGITEIRHTLPGSNGTTTDIDLTHPLNVDQIGLLAILNAPQLASERGQLDLAQADVIQSALLPNPSVSLGYAALLGGPGTTGAFTASLTQDIASLITYRSRVAAAHARADQVNADLLWQEWQVAQKARLLAVDIYWGARSIEATEQQLALVSSTTDAVRDAVAAHDLDLTVLSAQQGNRAGVEQSLETLRETQLNNWQALDALLGLQPQVRFTMTEPQVAAPPVEADADTMITNIQARRPDLIALRLGYDAADAGVRAAILGQFPAFVLGGSWNSDTSGVRSAGPLATFDLPIFNRNQGQVAQSRATRLLLHEQYQQQLDDTVGTIDGLHMQDQRIAAALTAARETAADARAQADAAQTAYQQRNIDQRSLADFVSTALQRKLDLINLERSRDEAHVALILELGLGLPATRIAPLDQEKSS